MASWARPQERWTPGSGWRLVATDMHAGTSRATARRPPCTCYSRRQAGLPDVSTFGFGSIYKSSGWCTRLSASLHSGLRCKWNFDSLMASEDLLRIFCLAPRTNLCKMNKGCLLILKLFISYLQYLLWQVEACGLLQFAAMFFFSERRKEEERTQSFKIFIEDFKSIFSWYTHTFRYIHIHTCTDTSYILIHTYTVVHRHT